MKRLPLISLLALVFIPTTLAAETTLYYLAIEPGRTHDKGYEFENPFRAVYQTTLGTSSSSIIKRDDFENVDELDQGDRLFLRKLFINPQNGTLVMAGVESGVRWAPSLSFNRSFELKDGGEVSLPFTSPANLLALPNSESNRHLRLWQSTSNGISELWQAPLPIPSDLPYEGAPFPSPDIPLTLSQPSVIIENLSFSFPTNEAYLPLHDKIYALSETNNIDRTPGIDFYKMTSRFGTDEFLGGGSTPSYQTSIIDQVHGKFYPGFASLNPAVVTFRPPHIYVDEDIIGSPHTITPGILRIHDSPNGGNLARFDLDGDRPLVFEHTFFDTLALDSFQGLLFTWNSQSNSFLKKQLNRPDSSAIAQLSAAQTNNSEFEWIAFGTDIDNVVSIQAEPVLKRLFYLLENGQLHSINYDGSNPTLEATLPSNTIEFALFNDAPLFTPPTAASLTFAGNLPFDDDDTGAQDLSADGSVILATADSGDETEINPALQNTRQATLLTRSGQAIALGFPRKDAMARYQSDPIALSGDGKTAILSSFVQGSPSEPATWSAAAGIITSEDYGTAFLKNAQDLNFDGSLFAGSYGSEPATWSTDAGLKTTNLPDSRDEEGIFTAVNDDGTTFAGNAKGGATEAFIYTEANGYTLLGDLPGGIFGSQANAISPNGQIVVGFSYTLTEGIFELPSPFIWTSVNGLQNIGSIDNTDSFTASGFAEDVNDQQVVIGNSGGRAFIYHPLTGILSLSDLLTNAYGLDLAGFTLGSANAISHDSKTIIGDSTKDGIRKGFIASLPNFPADALLFSSNLSSDTDSDGDGLSDFFEAATGSDPYNPSSGNPNPLQVTQSATATRLTFQKPPIAASGRITYSIEKSPSLAGPWTTTGLTILTDSDTELTITFPPTTRNFIRLVATASPAG